MSTQFLCLLWILGPWIVGEIGLPPVNAQIPPTPINCPQAASYIEPEQLISWAYAGNLKQQGIPGGQILLDEYEAGNVTPGTIITAAMAACWLSDRLNLRASSTYLNALDSYLQALSTQSN